MIASPSINFHIARVISGDLRSAHKRSTNLLGRGARHLVRQQPSGRVLVRVHPPDAHSQDPTAVSPTAPVPAAKGRAAGLSGEITRGSNPPNAFFPLLRDVRCPVRRARVCAEKRNSRAKAAARRDARPGTQGRRVYFGFFDVTLFPDSKNIYAPFHLVLAAYFAIRKLKAHLT